MQAPTLGFNPATKSILFHPIGYIESCFTFKNGTPRQGVIAPNAPAKLKVLTSHAFHSLANLDQYSHAWIIFWFHDNANIKTPANNNNASENSGNDNTSSTIDPTEKLPHAKEKPKKASQNKTKTIKYDTNSHDMNNHHMNSNTTNNDVNNSNSNSDDNTNIGSGHNTKDGSNNYTAIINNNSNNNDEQAETSSHEFDFFPNNDDQYLPYKRMVRPPRLDGKKVGLFATGTPHRPVPVGLTVAKIDKVVGDTVYFKGTDLIDGTPVIDIKPYIPQYDAIPEATTPPWITAASSPLTSVVFSEKSLQLLEEFLPKLKHFKNLDELRKTIEDLLLSDIRSVYRKQKCADELFGFHLDNLNVQCVVDGDCVNVVNIQYLTCALILFWLQV